jgi:hypothetical protein
MLVAAWLFRFYLVLQPGEIYLNHEAYSSVQRVIEFQDLLRAGYLFPHWAIDFRGGLGSPYFGYYQPGFFYVASVFAWLLPFPVWLAATLWTLALIGYGGVLALVRARFGTAGGVLAGTTLLVSPYVRTEAYWRGDCPELMGMMLLPPALHWLTSWLDGRRAAHWWGLSFAAAWSILAHPVAGLLSYGAFVVVIAYWVATGGDRRRAASALAALGVGVGLAAFYLAPVLLEWPLIEGGRLTMDASGFHGFPSHFVEVGELLGLRIRPGFVVRPGVGAAPLGLAAVALATVAWRRSRLPASPRRLVGALVVLTLGTTWLMHASSRVVWEAFPLLPFLQFPWRFLVVLTVALAALGGCLALGGRVVLMAGLALHGWTLWHVVPTPLLRDYLHPATARELATEFVAPDVADEWLPRGAARLRPPNVPTWPTCSGRCRVEGYERAAGVLRADVVAEQPSDVVLPHYFFPVGWSATFDRRAHRHRSHGRRASCASRCRRAERSSCASARRRPAAWARPSRRSRSSDWSSQRSWVPAVGGGGPCDGRRRARSSTRSAATVRRFASVGEDELLGRKSSS